MRQVMLAAVGLLLVGCAAHGRITALDVPADAAEVVVVRDHRAFVGTALTVYILIDGTPVYTVGNGQNAVIPVSPGRHVVGTAAGGWNGGSVPVEMAPHERRYFRVNIAPLSTGLSLEPISAEAGQAMLAR